MVTMGTDHCPWAVVQRTTAHPQWTRLWVHWAAVHYNIYIYYYIYYYNICDGQRSRGPLPMVMSCGPNDRSFPGSDRTFPEEGIRRVRGENPARERARLQGAISHLFAAAGFGAAIPHPLSRAAVSRPFAALRFRALSPHPFISGDAGREAPGFRINFIIESISTEFLLSVITRLRIA